MAIDPLGQVLAPMTYKTASAPEKLISVSRFQFARWALAPERINRNRFWHTLSFQDSFSLHFSWLLDAIGSQDSASTLNLLCVFISFYLQINFSLCDLFPCLIFSIFLVLMFAIFWAIVRILTKGWWPKYSFVVF